MAIKPKDRNLIAALATVYIAANVIAGRAAIAFEEGVLYAQKLLEVIDRRVGTPKKK